MKMFMMIMVLVYGDMPDGRIMSCQKFDEETCTLHRDRMIKDFDVAIGDTLYISKCIPVTWTKKNDKTLCEDVLNTLDFKKDMTILGKKR